MKHLPQWALTLLRWCVVGYLKTTRRTFLSDPCLDHKLLSQGVVYALWHDSLFTVPMLFPFFRQSGNDLHILISKSRDGDIPSDLAETFPSVHALRVGHTARAVALKRAIQLLKEQHSLLITPDGPKGPRRHAKGGVFTALALAKKPIVPISVSYARAFRCSSWDRFAIPLPFSSITIQLHTPIFPECDNSDLVGHLTTALSSDVDHLNASSSDLK